MGKYTIHDLMDIIKENDVKFIRLAYCDVFGVQKNISVMPTQLDKIFDGKISINASAVAGFSLASDDIYLTPDTDTFELLPWRPQHGRVARLYCYVNYSDGKPFENDTRKILVDAVKYAEQRGFDFKFGAKSEFYLFLADEKGNKTENTIDDGTYMDIAPDDRGENIRRDICLTMEEMGIIPESSHHEEGKGQNAVELAMVDPITLCDNVMTFRWAVKTIAARNGYYASFDPKPLRNDIGSGLHIKMSINNANENVKHSMAAGVLSTSPQSVLFYNNSSDSYIRLGSEYSPRMSDYGKRNSSAAMRLPTDKDSGWDMSLRLPDARVNPYLAVAIMIYSAIEGYDRKLKLEENIPQPVASSYEEAVRQAEKSDFISRILPASILEAYKFHGGR